MKKYLVIKEYKSNPIFSDIVGMFDNEEDANTFARLSRLSSSRKFWVYEQSE